MIFFGIKWFFEDYCVRKEIFVVFLCIGCILSELSFQINKVSYL
ncbi:hypothetical protein SALWKB29_0116 [Snodgrassella communis]|uniref:Uncharacterized protein n=1 Tax=Snodgrassella communis TaxID=2946699 RepID=A0A836Z3Q3_9NEIS|nr:hypothetical protein SALWKB29_0116 [Snodgrassella communis]